MRDYPGSCVGVLMMSKSKLFDGITDWLLERALREVDMTTNVRELAHRLIAGGLPIYRINVGGMILHPILGALDITWDANSDVCRSQSVPRSAVTSQEFQNTPFNNLARNNIDFERYRLDDPQVWKKFPILEALGKSGVTDYLVMFESYGRSKPLEWADLPANSEGAFLSFATRRIGGFTDEEIENLRSLSIPFTIVLKMANERTLATALLETYLGKISGKNVLNGLVEKGDGRTIECVLWYSDLRRSTAMAAELEIDAYLATINEYFDCTAGAVLDHGGEVLKFIGDGVMAIFPFEETKRPPIDMCNAAVKAVREALSRVAARNQIRTENGLSEIEFGVGLHVGKVMYGNVGTQQRLDLTVTGPAANEVARLESLSKNLGTPVITSAQFKSVFEGDLIALGNQDVYGIEGGLEAHTLPEFNIAKLRIAEN